MYRLDWLEQIKLRSAALPAIGQVKLVNPVVWQLGFTSLLTDVSSEMVNSILPVYLVLGLHASPLNFGVIDGIYHGMATALLSLAGGMFADRFRRHKEVAAAGYGLSGLCKLGLMAAGANWLALGAITAFDRVGKGVRTAPRDALLSLSSQPHLMATSFAVHRTLDAGGSLLGPFIAFLLLARLPGSYNLLWFTSFLFALLGFFVLLLFVQNPPQQKPAPAIPSLQGLRSLLALPSFRAIGFVGFALSAATASDGFLYLLLQRKSGMAVHFFPLYYVLTATFYMLFSIPAGRLADRWGRPRVFLLGYGAMLAVYAMLASSTFTSGLPILPLLLCGIYYAATEGILMAIASSIIPPGQRTGGLAVLNTLLGFGRMLSSIVFGLIWQTYDDRSALAVFSVALVVSMTAGWWSLRSMRLNSKYDAPSEA